MSSASVVPETYELRGDQARETLQAYGALTLLKAAFQRLRFADAFSHARSLAYTISLVLVQATIALVGFASAFGSTRASAIVVRIANQIIPGPASNIVTNAVTQARHAGSGHHYTGLIVGLISAIVTTSTLLGQMERGLNRLYGVEVDRPTVQKYRRAATLSIVIGLLTVVAFASLVFGQEIGDSIDNGAINAAWAILRWPLGIALATLAITILYRTSPRRRQPALSWLAYGAALASLFWTASSILLGLFFRYSKGFGQTYGALAGIVAMLVWALLCSVAILYGAAVSAQLEAVRAGNHAPQDPEKVAHSEPLFDAVHLHVATAAR